MLATGLAKDPWLIGLAFLGAVGQCANGIARRRALSRSPIHELRSAAHLLRHELGRLLIARYLCGVLSLALLLFIPSAAFALALAGEVIGRYLFFAAVVPKGMASTYLTPKEAAA